MKEKKQIKTKRTKYHIFKFLNDKSLLGLMYIRLDDSETYVKTFGTTKMFIHSTSEDLTKLISSINFDKFLISYDELKETLIKTLGKKYISVLFGETIYFSNQNVELENSRKRLNEHFGINLKKYEGKIKFDEREKSYYIYTSESIRDRIKK